MTQASRRLGLVVAVAAGLALTAPTHADALSPTGRVGMVCTPGTVAGSTHTFNLVAEPGYIDTPDGNSVYMWGYADAATNNGHFQSPGPVLCVAEGQTVVVNLSNTLPEASSIVFPGQDAAVTPSGGSAGLLTREAAASSGTVSYSFTAGAPGTYLYESGSDPAKQVQMGLYGAVVVRPTLGNNFAYDSSASQFDPANEYLLLLADVDPDLHHAVETNATYDLNALRSRYFTINGRSFPDTIQDNGSALLPNQPYGSLVRIRPDTSTSQASLIRIINAGLLNHPFHPHGNHTSLIAQDGRLITGAGGALASTEHFGETIGSGQTQDYLLRWSDQDHWDPSANPFPVTPPNYRNVTFKDGNTFYSGSPYLGYKGTLPTGVVSQNVCGEWYFPWHSHALNEFSNYDVGFGGMGTLLRVDPPDGCTGFPTSAVIVNGALKSGSVTALGADDTTFYQVNSKTTTRPTATTSTQTSITVASASGFPTSGAYHVQIDNEVLQVTAGQGTTTWTVTRGQLGTTAAAHAANATVYALATDWYSGLSGVPAGSANLKVTYKGENCGSTSTTTCVALAAGLQQTVKICDWVIAGAAGCAGPAGTGWVTLPAPPAQPVTVGSTQVTSTWTPAAGQLARYIGTGSYNGQVRVLVHTQRPTPSTPIAFQTWGNLMKITYDAP